jgi:triacylglycerol lipase
MPAYEFQADINKFDAHTTRYNGENALVLADCARLAYRPEAEIKDALQGVGKFNNFAFFSAKSTDAYMAGNDTVIIVAFRGTEIMKIADVITDKKLWQTETGIASLSGKVHAGFKGALHEVWDSMIKTLKEFQNKQQTVWFCGHSLGAALATLAVAEYVGNEGGRINGLYTIGQPRVGNSKFAGEFDSKVGKSCFRFVNNNDVVPQLPLWGPLLNYTHIGNLIYIDSKGDFHDSVSLVKHIWDRLKGATDDIGQVGVDHLKDHGAGLYVDLIAKNRSVTTKWS